MKTKQKDIAQWLGITEAFLSEIANSKKGFSKANAWRISKLSGVPVELLIITDGKRILRNLTVSYLYERGL